MKRMSKYEQMEKLRNDLDRAFNNYIERVTLNQINDVLEDYRENGYMVDAELFDILKDCKFRVMYSNPGFGFNKVKDSGLIRLSDRFDISAIDCGTLSDVIVNEVSLAIAKLINDKDNGSEKTEWIL